MYQVALIQHIRRYWPIFDAEEQASEFIAQFYFNDHLQRIQRSKGRLRAYLLQSLRNFLRQTLRRQRAQKRGGGLEPASLDRVAADPVASPEAPQPSRQFEIDWAQEVLSEAYRRARLTFTAPAIFDVLLRLYLRVGADTTLGRVAASMGMTEAAVRTSAARFRAALRAAIDQVLRESALPGVSLENERADLFRALRRDSRSPETEHDGPGPSEDDGNRDESGAEA